MDGEIGATKNLMLTWPGFGPGKLRTQEYTATRRFSSASCARCRHYWGPSFWLSLRSCRRATFVAALSEKLAREWIRRSRLLPGGKRNARRGKSTGEKKEWDKHFWIKGHVRAQWYQKTEEHKPILIAPHIHGNLEAPLHRPPVVNVVRR